LGEGCHASHQPLIPVSQDGYYLERIKQLIIKHITIIEEKRRKISTLTRHKITVVHNGNCQTKCAKTDYVEVEENFVQMQLIQNSGE